MNNVASASQFLMIVILSLFQCPCYADGPFAIQRSKGMDAVNVLYLFTNHWSKNIEPGEFADSAKLLSDSPNSLTFCQASERLACPARIVSLSIDELSRVQLPVVVHTRGEGSTNGKWHLLAYIAKDHVGVVRGETMIVDLVSLSDFRSEWNGHAIIAVVPVPTELYVIRVCSLVVSSGILGFLMQKVSQNVR